MKIAIVHYGESVPTDTGYAPGRYGTLARVLHGRGHEVVRVAPTFEHRTKEQRTRDRTLASTNEGVVRLVPTRGYQRSRSISRLLFLRDFARGALNYLSDAGHWDRVLFGFPPISTLKAISSHPLEVDFIAADIRDLWPDAQIRTVGPLPRLALSVVSPYIRRRVGSGLRVVDGLAATSQEYLRWGLAHRRTSCARTGIFPIGAPTAAVQPTGARHDVAFVGSLSEHFDFKLLLNAWKLACTSRKSADLLQETSLNIYGDGPLRALIERHVAEVGVPRVHLCGRIDRDKVNQVLTSASVGVAPYRRGASMSLPNKLFDYMAAGLPIVSTLGGEMAHFLDTYGLGSSLPDATPSSFAETLSSLVADEARRKEIERRAIRLANGMMSRSEIASRFADWLLVGTG